MPDRTDKYSYTLSYLILWWKHNQSTVILIVSRSSHNVKSSKVSSDIRGNILKDTYYKIRKHVVSFQHAMAHNTPSDSNKQECAHMERRLDQEKKHSRTNSKSCSFILNTLGFSLYRIRQSSPCNFSYLSQFGYSFSCVHLILTDLSIPYISQHFWSQCNLRIILTTSIPLTRCATQSFSHPSLLH